MKNNIGSWLIVGAIMFACIALAVMVFGGA